MRALGKLAVIFIVLPLTIAAARVDDPKAQAPISVGNPVSDLLVDQKSLTGPKSQTGKFATSSSQTKTAPPASQSKPGSIKPGSGKTGGGKAPFGGVKGAKGNGKSGGRAFPSGDRTRAAKDIIDGIIRKITEAFTPNKPMRIPPLPKLPPPQIMVNPRTAAGSRIDLIGMPQPSPQPGKHPCSYDNLPTTTAIESASYVKAYKEPITRLIIRENIVAGPLLGAYVVQLPSKFSATEISQLVRKMFLADARRGQDNKGCRYQYIEPDYQLHDTAAPIPNDEGFQDQWNLQSVARGAAHFDEAWDVLQRVRDRRPLADIVIAIVDDGFASAPPIGSLVPSSGTGPELQYLPGYALATDNDAVGCQRQEICHGTVVATVLGAITNNRQYLAGALGIGESPYFKRNFHILPVTIPYTDTLMESGKWEHATTAVDVVRGLTYAAGEPIRPGCIGILLHCFHVTKRPPLPADVINLSMSSHWVCIALQQDAVNEIIQKGKIVVASAGNDIPASDPKLNAGAPANCTGVIAVTAHDKEDRSVLGFYPGEDSKSISAPGFSIPIFHFSDWMKGREKGTSLAAPQVAAAIAMIRAVYPALRWDQALKILQDSGRPPIPLPGNSFLRRHPGLNAKNALDRTLLLHAPFQP